jgi:hypothetical protein
MAVTLPVIRLLTISLLFGASLPVVPAMAGWRDGYYADDGWGEGYYPPAGLWRRHAMIDPEEYQPGYNHDYRRPWIDRRAYAPRYYEGPVYGAVPDDDFAPVMRPRATRPPRNVWALPPDRMNPSAKTRLALPSTSPLKQQAGKPVFAQAPFVLPVPRPNLESMDFEPPAGPPPHLSVNEIQR